MIVKSIKKLMQDKMLTKLSIFIMSMSAVLCRDANKYFKSMPAISNSLVNLGKMDISFHFNSKPYGVPDISLAEMRSEPVIHSPNTYFSKPESTAEDCLCSGLYNNKNSFVSSPSDMLNKILRSNDLFSFNKEPVTSPTCCDSHEHVQEDTVFFELGPKPHQIDVNHQPQPNNPVLPLIFDHLFPNKPSLPTLPIKPKAIEIFFFPKNKETQQEFIRKDVFGKDFMQTQTKKKDLMKKSEIQIVGDKELRNDFQSLKFRPSFSITSFGKKDTGMEKEKIKEYVEQTTQASVDNKQKENTETTKKDVIVSNMNAL